MSTPNLPSLQELTAPRDWELPAPLRQRLRVLQAQVVARDRHGHALGQVEAIQREKAAQLVHSRMADREICGLAARRVDLLHDELQGLTHEIDAASGGGAAADAGGTRGGVRGGAADGGRRGQPRADAHLPVPPEGATSIRVGDWRGRSEGFDPSSVLARLNALVEPLQGRAFELRACKPADRQLRALVKRAGCELWWRRQLRRAVVRLREAEGARRGEVCAHRQLYVTDDTLRRRAESILRNAAILESTVLESEDGEEMRVAQAAGASTSNRAIRRGELMTRIRGCEEWAELRGMAGLFTTNTAPSRFHRVRHISYGGGPNPKADGTFGPIQPNGPRDAQAWLRDTWAKTRAKLSNMNIPFFGFRVAEPHHDGCPHWHMLLWTSPENVERLRSVMRTQWLKDHPDEDGAQRNRFDAKVMEKGGASGYIAKYIAKNIDDETMQIDGALDAEAGRDLLGGSAAKRVEAWASAHGIRQFQAIGQPPVTVWRELRRIEADRLGGASPAVKKAHEAATRGIARRADWCGYMSAQGGAMTGRDYRVRMLTEETEVLGRYGATTDEKPIGVIDAARPDDWILSGRREWRPRGTWTRKPAPAAAPLLFTDVAKRIHEERVGGLDASRPLGIWLGAQRTASAPTARPWTRVNNCTDDGGPVDLMRVGLVGLALRKPEPGGSNHTGEPPWTLSRPSNPPLTLPSRPSSTLSTPSARA